MLGCQGLGKTASVLPDSNLILNRILLPDGRASRVKLNYRIELRQSYHRHAGEFSKSYLPILEEIRVFFGGGLYSRSRMLNNSLCHSFTMATFSLASNKAVVEYFQAFPHFSSKHLNYLNWAEAYQMISSKKHLMPEGAKIIYHLKQSMNRQRTEWTWSHLAGFYRA